MVDKLNVYKQCGQCKGTGIIVINNEDYDPGPPQEVPCSFCDGTGEILWGEMREEEQEDG